MFPLGCPPKRDISQKMRFSQSGSSRESIPYLSNKSRMGNDIAEFSWSTDLWRLGRSGLKNMTMMKLCCSLRAPVSLTYFQKYVFNTIIRKFCMQVPIIRTVFLVGVSGFRNLLRLFIINYRKIFQRSNAILKEAFVIIWLVWYTQ
jgi:hypothetical protein